MSPALQNAFWAANCLGAIVTFEMPFSVPESGCAVRIRDRQRTGHCGTISGILRVLLGDVPRSRLGPECDHSYQRHQGDDGCECD